ncbi:hypothetical protein LTR10_020446 [Elasticomyces elasticus]|uniref:Uncharacterized protein n=1 Tax=Exophiala sideris TaxID=1016849 RepID=A0ABR0J3M5_9EURO|nr:hypothetical protein LTR10_020446 [Elasticomyces elasticus]KAK5027030.1 hypothetical protein LTS07_007329 [Exophiala sideris]KAK5034034.1 hypothetical protein LTR13_006634 [Exophiala sideris]KAK5055691.1 hypothetical protein LTR69_008066 [Exophiala sideris]KAK5180976.1 hypothetical protein LTR44_006796 [Eurotiomycetes sp. CCFEE 6388]
MASVLEQHGFKFVNYPDGEEFADKFHFSHAVIVPPNVRTIVVSGQVGIRADGTVPSDISQEASFALDKVAKALRAAGLGEDALEYVFDVTFYFAGGMETTPFVEVVKKRFKNTRPATVGLEVAKLLHPDLHLEIKAVAFCL